MYVFGQAWLFKVCFLLTLGIEISHSKSSGYLFTEKSPISRYVLIAFQNSVEPMGSGIYVQRKQSLHYIKGTKGFNLVEDKTSAGNVLALIWSAGFFLPSFKTHMPKGDGGHRKVIFGCFKLNGRFHKFTNFLGPNQDCTFYTQSGYASAGHKVFPQGYLWQRWGAYTSPSEMNWVSSIEISNMIISRRGLVCTSASIYKSPQRTRALLHAFYMHMVSSPADQTNCPF